MPRVSKAHVAARRAQILDAARRVFARKGIQAATIAEICEEAGLSAGAIYTHFDGKAAIQEAVHAQAREANRRFPDAVRAAEDPVAAVVEMAGAMFRILEDPALRLDHQLSLHVVAEVAHDDALRASYAKVHHEMVDAFTALLADHVDPEAVDVEYLMWAVTCLYQGARAQKMVVGDLDTERLGNVVRALLAPALEAARLPRVPPESHQE